MSFSADLLKEIEDSKWDVDAFVDSLKAKKIGIWGTGVAGKMVYNWLQDLGLQVNFFASNIADEKELYGIEVIGEKELPLNTFVFIAANVKYGIHKQLDAIEQCEYMYIDPEWVNTYGKKNVVDVIRQNAEKINYVYDVLEDEFSKKIYKNILLHRAIHNLTKIFEIYDEHQYFENRIVRKATGNFVDCGAFQGDTLVRFLEQIEKDEYKYFAIEADKENYAILENLCATKKLTNVVPMNLGVWDRQEKLCFEGGELTGASSKVSSEGAYIINADKIDSIINEKVNFIKMDIEGAEPNALLGAEKCIKEYEPILAISIYHELEHLWEIPIMIKKLNPNYKLYLGHHMWNMHDTVCYGVCKK